MAVADVAADVADLGLRRSISSFAGSLVAAQVAGVSLTQVGVAAPVLFRTQTVPCDGATATMASNRGIGEGSSSSPSTSVRIHQIDHVDRRMQSGSAKASPQIEPQPTPMIKAATPRQATLLLPVPARTVQGGVGNCGWSIHSSLDEDATALPPMMLPVVTHLAEASTSSRKSARPLPARLQRLDDQMVMPREVYNRMLQQGDLARGSLGYGQHRLAFQGPEGKPVLRRVAG